MGCNRKPVLIFTFRQGEPSADERDKIYHLIKKPELIKDYHIFIIFEERVQGCTKGTTIELLQKGRNTKSIIKKLNGII